MATRTLLYQTSHVLHAVACQEVQVCLTEAWADETVSGSVCIIATLGQSVRNLGGIDPIAGLAWNVRGQNLIQYTLDIDDTQFTAPETDFPTCADIVAITPFTCDCDVAVIE